MATRSIGILNLLRDAKPAWICIGGMVTAWMLACLAADEPTRRVLYAGTWLQLAGLVSVALGFKERQRLFGLPLITTRVSEWFRRFVAVIRGGRSHTVAAAAAAVGSVGLDARASVVRIPRVGAPLEERISALEQNAERLRIELDERFAAVTKDVQHVRAKIDEERSARLAGEQTIAMRLERFAIGDLDAEVVGVIWLFFSTLATSIPTDVVWVFNWL
jgi:hypothetical protein